MRDDDVPVKTHDGAVEMKTRALGLAPRVRTALLLVDGIRSIRELEPLLAASGVKPGTLELLLEKGLICVPRREIPAVPVEAPVVVAAAVAVEPIAVPSPQATPISVAAPVPEKPEPPEPAQSKTAAPTMDGRPRDREPVREAAGFVSAAPADMKLVVARAHLANALDDHIEGYALKQMVTGCTSRAELVALFGPVQSMLVRLLGNAGSVEVMALVKALLDSPAGAGGSPGT